MEIKNEGFCRCCSKTYAGRGMARHIKACKVKKEQDAKALEKTKRKTLDNIYLIKLVSYQPFWLYIEMKGSAKLKDLDQFLRDIWMECCGHLSQFRIKEECYEIEIDEAYTHPFDEPTKSMDVTIQSVLSLKEKFQYEYDFGSTSFVEGHIMDVRQGVMKEKIKIIARNNLPEMICTECHKHPAEYVDPGSYDGFYCKSCLSEDNAEWFLPVVNSPRMGVCGYTGNLDFDDWKPKTSKR